MRVLFVELVNAALTNVRDGGRPFTALPVIVPLSAHVILLCKSKNRSTMLGAVEGFGTSKIVSLFQPVSAIGAAVLPPAGGRTTIGTFTELEAVHPVALATVSCRVVTPVPPAR